MRRQPRRSLLSLVLSRLQRSPKPQNVSAPVRPFQAISIFRGVQACKMARTFGEHRFLARDAPQLPLSGCNMPERCECCYIRHKDRRAEGRRLVYFGTSPRAFDGAERRARRGRRAAD